MKETAEQNTPKDALQEKAPTQPDAGVDADAAAEDAEAPQKTYAGMTRRTLCLGVGSFVVLLGLGAIKPLQTKSLVRPPGGQDEDRLLSLCIRCEKCYEACPNGVIRPAHIEDGVLGMRTPTLNFENNWCDWCQEANGGDPLCVKTCQTEALTLPAGSTLHSTIIGKAYLDNDLCLAQRGLGCRFCYDACPYDAMDLDGNGRPYVITDRCNGCGACESVCVSLENGSISVGATTRAITVRTVEEVEGLAS